MGSFKRWIARLFNIKTEDLPEQEQQLISRDRLNETIQEEVRWQLRSQTSQLIKDLVVSEVQRLEDASPRPTLEDANAALTTPDEFPEIEDSLIPPPSSGDLDPDILPETIEDLPAVELPEIDLPQEPDLNLPVLTQIDDLPKPGDEHYEVTVPIIEEEHYEEIAPIIEEEHYEEITPIIEDEPYEEIAPIIDDKKEKPSLIAVQPDDIRIGIDFGTTTTVVSVKIGDDKPEAIPIGRDGYTRYMPSVVLINPGTGPLEDRVIVGEDAEASTTDSSRVIRSVKRCFGCKSKSCHTEPQDKSASNRHQVPAWCQGHGKIIAGPSETVSPAEIATLIVKEALARTIAYLQERRNLDISQKNIILMPLNMGCGANYTLDQRKMMSSIAVSLGFKNFRVVNVYEEPILAGFMYSRFATNPEGKMLIYDFGGGTLDVAILNVDRQPSGQRITVISTAGNNWLGGDDIDEQVYNYFLELIAQQTGYPSSQVHKHLNQIEQTNLKLQARRAKELLTTQDLYSDSLLSDKLGILNLEISRQQFRDLLTASQIIEKSLSVVRQACRQAYAYENAAKGTTFNPQAIIRHQLSDAARTINRVVLVGGVTRIPFVRRRIAEVFGPNKIVQEDIIDPISAVSIGAAYSLSTDHFSINTPPIGFVLEYEIEGKNGKKRIELIRPYDHIEYFEGWTHDTTGTFYKQLDILEEYLNAKVLIFEAEAPEHYAAINIGRIPTGIWRFGISMDGRISTQSNNQRVAHHRDYPLIHPIQKSIRDARSKTIRNENTAQQGRRSYDDDIQSMMTEN